MNMFSARFRQMRLRIGGALVICALPTVLLVAQSPAARIAAEANDSDVTVLKNSQHPLARAANDAGRMPAGTRLTGVTVHFSRSSAQEAELDALMAAQLDPSSRQFHQWLTPEQFGARFGMAQADLDKVTQWLERQGMAVDEVNPSRTYIRFSGTVAQVEAAFRTEMHFYNSDGETRFAPSSALSVPTAFAGAISGVRNLTSFRPHSMKVQPRGDFTSATSGNNFLAPGDIATAYDIKPLTSGGNDGTGQSIVIAGQSLVSVTDVEAFQAAAGLPKKDPTLTLVPGSGTSVKVKGDEGESDLDLEWSGAVAPGASIVFVYTGNNTNFGVFDSVQYAVDHNLGQVISMSYAACETELAASDLTSLDGMFKQAAVQGQTVMSSSGDQGSTACSGFTNLSAAQQQEIAVNYPASSPYVTGIGGTEISAANVKNSTYWLTASSSDVINSLKQYIPEVVWNDSSTSGLSATGGGVSVLEGKPSYQAALTPHDGARDVPDVSFFSSPQNVAYLYCTSDVSSWASTQKASCDKGFRDNATGSLTAAGGTSFASPVFAGMVAILNQATGHTKGQGLVNPTLYSLAGDSATYAAAFHDVTSGNNDCVAGPTYCGTTTGGFSAGPGYDMATGLGSLDLAKLVAAWPAGAVVTPAPTVTTITASKTSPTINTAVTFTVTVLANASASVPTGSVSLSVDGGTATTQALDAKGVTTLSQTFTTTGNHTVTATYAGNTTFAASATATATVNVVAVSSGGGKIALGASNVTVAQGAKADSTITVTPSGGYTGTVLMALSTQDANLQNLCYNFATTDSRGNGTISVTSASAATTTLTLDAKASDCATGAAIVTTGMHKITYSGSGAAHKEAPQPTGGKSLPAGLTFAGLLLAGCLAKAGRKLRGLACVVALAALGMGLTACGSSTSSGSNSTVPNPPKGTYTVTIAAQDSTTATITAQTSFGVTIN